METKKLNYPNIVNQLFSNIQLKVFQKRKEEVSSTKKKKKRLRFQGWMKMVPEGKTGNGRAL